MATITLSEPGISPGLWGEVQPLTTTWMPPPGCPEVVQLDRSNLACAPPNYAKVWDRYGYYSPGVCPHKYTVGTTLGPRQSINGNRIGPFETAAICVPSGYTAWPYVEDYIIYAGISVVAPAAEGRDWDGTSRVPAFQIRWASSDSAILAPRSLEPASFTAADSLPGPTSGLPAPTASDSPSPGLSSGTTAGIAVGVVVALALMLAAGWFFLRRYRRERMKPRLADAELEVGGAGGQGPSELHVETASPELDGSAVPVVEKQVEKDDAAVVEVDADEIPTVGGQHPQSFPARDGPELAAQASGSNNASPVEMDATPAQAIPARHAAKLPPNTPLPPAPPEPHAAAPGRSQAQTPSQTASHDTDGEIARLLERKAKVDERRRALELEQLDAEAADIELRLGQLQGGGSSQPCGGS